MPAQQPLWADSYAPGVPLHLDYGDTTVLGLWESATQRYPGRPALDFLGRVSTYAEVADEIRHVAGGLHALGVRAGDNVALVMPNCPQNVIAFFAVPRFIFAQEPKHGRRPSLSRFLATGMQTLTGHCTGSAAMVQTQAKTLVYTPRTSSKTVALVLNVVASQIV